MKRDGRSRCWEGVLFGMKAEKEADRLKIFHEKCRGSYHILVENKNIQK